MRTNGGNAVLPLRNGKTARHRRDGFDGPSGSEIHTICGDGDIILVCSWSPKAHHDAGAPETSLSFRVSSNSMKSASSYFAALLDPVKFSEGRRVQQVNVDLDAKYGSRDTALRLAATDELAHVDIQLPPLAAKQSKLAVTERFLNILTWWSSSNRRPTDEEPNTPLDGLGDLTIPFLTSLAVVADRLGATTALHQALRASAPSSKSSSHADSMSKIVRRLRTYHGENEERIRQAIYLALILDDHQAARNTMHKLIVHGSREWSYDLNHEVSAGVERALWWHLPREIEEELYFRHQCILNTIADLQNHFLRAYGAFPATSSKPSSRQIQCPRAYDNSHACDSFHLGEMIRFFSARTRTISVESCISSPDVDLDSEAEGDSYAQSTPTATLNGLSLAFPASTQPSQTQPTNIPNIISSLRQCPEYQIDPNHAGCGIRRRLIPGLDCLETFTNSQSGALGICLFHWKQGVGSWREKLSSSPKSSGVTISRTGAIEGVAKHNHGLGRHDASCACVPRAEEARALFVSKHRQWNL